MSEQIKNTKKHIILDIPFLGAALIGALSFIFSELLFGGVGTAVDLMFGLKSVYSCFAGVIGALVFLVIYRLIFRGEYKGSFRLYMGSKKIALIILVTAVLDVVLVCSSMFKAGLPSLGLPALGASLMAAVCEEVSFRAVPMSCAMRKMDSKISMIIAMAISIISFGIVHSINALGGQSLLVTVFQIIFAAAFGLFTGAVYLRTGNLTITIIIHFLHDFLAMIQYPVDSGNIVTEMSSTDLIFTLVISLVFAIAGILVLKGQGEEIKEVWKERWNM